jgi:HTH-like domain
MSAPDRRAMLDRADKALSLRRQCTLLGVPRSGVYRLVKPANDNDAALIRRIDELFTAWPFLGSRRMTAMLRAEGLFVNRKRVQRLMRLMGIAALGPKPRTSKPAPGHRIYPYLLRNVAIDRPNHVWAADITYIPIGRGFRRRATLAGASGRWGHGGRLRRWLLPNQRWRAGAWTSCPTNSPTAAASKSWPLWTTAPASAWRWWRTARYPACAWRGSWTPLCASAGGRR